MWQKQQRNRNRRNRRDACNRRRCHHRLLLLFRLACFLKQLRCCCWIGMPYVPPLPLLMMLQ
jgi:hypothetical protein